MHHQSRVFSLHQKSVEKTEKREQEAHTGVKRENLKTHTKVKTKTVVKKLPPLKTKR